MVEPTSIPTRKSEFILSPPEKTIKRRAATDGETALPCRTAQLKINILVYYTKINEKTQKETVAKFHFLQRPDC